MIAILLRGRAHPLKVGAGARFGHRDRGDRLARHHFGQPVLLLLFAAIFDDIGGDDVRLEREARGCAAVIRSEEHTSELQSLMRISYAVFCLKKKNKTTNNRSQ